MRGAKKDVPLTKMLRANGLLLDRRSFVGYQGDMTPHLYLKGADIVVLRLEVWKRSRQKCGICKEPITSPDWELDHIQGGNFRRCDCLHNLRAVHGDCHRKRHVNVKLQAVEDFNKLYPEGA